MKPSLRATFDRSFLFSCGSILLLAVAVPALAAPVVFDFDTGTPVLTVGKNAPFSQTAGGVTASFSSVSGSFSIQNDASAGLSLSQFSGKYVYPNVLGSVLEVKFDKLLSNLDLVFATADFPPIEIPTPVTLTAYMNSAASTPVGSVTVRATYGTDTLPMGTLSFSPGAPFNLVRMTIQSGGGMGFLVDNLAVQVSPATAYAIATSASPSSGGNDQRGRHLPRRVERYRHCVGEGGLRLRKLDRERHAGQHLGQLHIQRHGRSHPGSQFREDVHRRDQCFTKRRGLDKR